MSTTKIPDLEAESAKRKLQAQKAKSLHGPRQVHRQHLLHLGAPSHPLRQPALTAKPSRCRTWPEIARYGRSLAKGAE